MSEPEIRAHEKLIVLLTKNTSEALTRVAAVEYVSRTDAVNRAIIAWDELTRLRMTGHQFIVRDQDGRDRELTFDPPSRQRDPS